MLAKVWRDNKFTGTQCRVSGNDGRGFCQVCDLVRFTTCRGESLLKAYEKISVGWSVQGYSSFKMVAGINCAAGRQRPKGICRPVFISNVE
jgi:hypothetical protein